VYNLYISDSVNVLIGKWKEREKKTLYKLQNCQVFLYVKYVGKQTREST